MGKRTYNIKKAGPGRRYYSAHGPAGSCAIEPRAAPDDSGIRLDVSAVPGHRVVIDGDDSTEFIVRNLGGDLRTVDRASLNEVSRQAAASLIRALRDWEPAGRVQLVWSGEFWNDLASWTGRELDPVERQLLDARISQALAGYGHVFRYQRAVDEVVLAWEHHAYVPAAIERGRPLALSEGPVVVWRRRADGIWRQVGRVSPVEVTS